MLRAVESVIRGILDMSHLMMPLVFSTVSRYQAEGGAQKRFR